MKIEHTFSTNLRNILQKNNISPEQLCEAFEKTNHTGHGLTLRTIKSYISLSASTKINPSLKTLQAIITGLTALGVETSLPVLFSGKNNQITSKHLLESVKYLAISQNDISDKDLITFFDVFNKLGADKILMSAHVLNATEHNQAEKISEKFDEQK
ncbi:hypothetical protein [Pseudoalteromonas denitrificans]|uniref:Uncharacterized protein n=1 Tax=Pseudoalteromonas denitrificans DSM 6059 TaxID=1123010 RepID=A0A1I1H2G5_9GAMM|nr:hypothetical protein [Pseudoalteromonas denitrificans]SFC15370.1 hypothetical protein SAMN02745724_01040 [Pseudoalteromonas denitrificans DSM 6059]